MAKKSDVYVHPETGERIQTWKGFSWPAFAFGVFWAMHKRMNRMALLLAVVFFFTFLIGWFIFGLMANEEHAKFLRAGGFLPEKEVQKRQAFNQHAVRTGAADELLKYAELHRAGAIDAQEFAKIKKKLLETAEV